MSFFAEPEVDPSANGHVPEAGEDEAPVKQLHILDLWEMFNKKPPPPLVHELLDENTLTLLAGAEGSGKSFLAIGLACAVATPYGMDFWEGRKIYNHGPVLYIAAEGAEGLGNRIKVWCEANGVDPGDLAGNMHFIDDAIPLEDPDYRALLMHEVDRMQPVLIIIDTKSAMTASVDENSANEQQMIINFLKKVKGVSNACVLIIHHMNKSGDQRGSNVWPTSVDSYLKVVPNEEEFESEVDRPLVIFCQKHKDRPDRCSHEFIMKVVRGEDGKPRSRVILQPQVDPSRPIDQERGAQYRSAALALLQEAGPLSQAKWVQLLVAEGMVRGTAYRAIKYLIDKNLVWPEGGKPERFSVSGAGETAETK